MILKRLAAICAICVIIALSLTLFAAIAEAQDSKAAKSSDKTVAQKRGVSQSLASTDDDDDDGIGPNKLQMGVGIGSCFVMYGVMKYL